ncbi:MAG: hypothetical protein ACI9WC_000439 [Arenicella sp.]
MDIVIGITTAKAMRGAVTTNQFSTLAILRDEMRQLLARITTYLD